MSEPESSRPAKRRVAIPERVGQFRVLRQIGRGGMAVVFLAEQDSLKRQVALKVLRADRVAESDETLIRRFEQEALASAALNHKNIVQVYAVGEADGAGGPHGGEKVRYIAQEYVPGPTLREYLKKKGPPDAATAVHILRQVADALQAADEAGIVHRDVKPENILLTRGGTVKITDFGLARLAAPEDGDSLHLTQEGIAVGTPLYMSPEQVNGGKLDRRSDIYSLGVTAYHLLGGGPPFRGDNAMAIAVKHLSETPRPLAELRPDLPPVLCEMVHRMLAKRPEDRYQSAADLGEDLNRLRGLLAESPGRAAKTTLASLRGAKAVERANWPLALDSFFDWSRGRHLAVLLPLCLLVGVCGAGVGWATRPADPFETPPGEPGVRKMENAEAQFAAALLADQADPGTEAFWLAVLDHFPDDDFAVAQARDKLALWYLNRDRLTEADSLYRRQAVLDPVRLGTSTYRRLTANAVAGRALIAARRGDRDGFARLVKPNLIGVVREAVDEELRLPLAGLIVADGERFGDADRRWWAGQLEDR